MHRGLLSGKKTASSIHPLGVLVQQKGSKILFCVPLKRDQDPAPRLHYCFLTALHPVSASPPFPNGQLFEPALWNSGKVREDEAYSLNIRNGGHREACAPKPRRARGMRGSKKEKQGTPRAMAGVGKCREIKERDRKRGLFWKEGWCGWTDTPQSTKLRQRALCSGPCDGKAS